MGKRIYIARFADGEVRHYQRPSGWFAWKISGLPGKPKHGSALSHRSAEFRCEQIIASDCRSRWHPTTIQIAPITRETTV